MRVTVVKAGKSTYIELNEYTALLSTEQRLHLFKNRVSYITEFENSDKMDTYKIAQIHHEFMLRADAYCSEYLKGFWTYRSDDKMRLWKDPGTCVHLINVAFFFEKECDRNMFVSNFLVMEKLSI